MVFIDIGFFYGFQLDTFLKDFKRFHKERETGLVLQWIFGSGFFVPIIIGRLLDFYNDFAFACSLVNLVFRILPVFRSRILVLPNFRDRILDFSVPIAIGMVFLLDQDDVTKVKS